MREIKYRQPIFLDGKFLKWHYWGFVDNSFVGVISPIEEAHKNSQQFTGLQDKNGKEIFEGDVIHCDNGSVGIITYDEERIMYRVDSEFKTGFCHPVYGYAPPFEVIGNIYENSDLTAD